MALAQPPPPLRNGTGRALENFHKFFECWLVEQNQYLQELLAASSSSDPTNNAAALRPLLHRVVDHYEHYYRFKTTWAKSHVLSMFNPSWRSSLEDAFLWIGGWRPTMAFHLLYSKAGLQLDANLTGLLNGLSTGDLGDLSPHQLDLIDKLHGNTIREEKAITEKLAKHQETVAEPAMVELAQAATAEEENGGDREMEDDGRVEAALASKEEGLVKILQKADNLRLKTLKAVVDILTPIQSVHFLTAAAELHLRVHEWGKKRDARHSQVHENQDQGHGQGQGQEQGHS